MKKLRRPAGKASALEAEMLLAAVLGVTREEILAHDERAMPAYAAKKYRSFLSRRAKHEPVAYIIGRKEFFGLPFFVSKHTLIPRPETELLVEEALAIIAKNENTIFSGTPPTPSFSKRGRELGNPPLGQGRVGRVLLDVGTGSGAIAIAIAKNSPNATVIATDISKGALKTAAKNAALNEVQDQIIFEHANLLPPKIARPSISGRVIITANLPYLPTKVWREAAPDVKNFEPRTALIGGKDGLRYYDELFHQIVERDIRGFVICEIDPSQKKTFPELALRHFPGAKVEIKNDLAGLARVAVISF
jgi:release factor glutamine methyltransferase